MAVLLDNFLAASNEMKNRERARLIEEGKSHKHLRNPLDPLLLKLSKEYVSEADLSEILQDLFKVCVTETEGEGEGESVCARASVRDPTGPVQGGQIGA